MAFIGLERLSPSRMSMGRDGRDGCLSFSLLVCLSGKRFIFLVMQRPALNISVYKTHIRGIWKMEAEVPASIAETSRKVHVKFTWGESGLGILEKQMASAGGSLRSMEMAEGTWWELRCCCAKEVYKGDPRSHWRQNHQHLVDQHTTQTQVEEK